MANTSDDPTQSESASPSATKQKMQDLAETLKADAPGEVNPPEEQNGLPPVIRSIDTNDKVVFMTIDDGGTKDPRVTKIIENAGIPVTPFLTVNVTESDIPYFKNIVELTGQKVQNHTINHRQMPLLSDSEQRREICEPSDKYTEWFGTRPWMFRPPYGEFNAKTQAAAKECGGDYVVLWNVSLPQRYLRYAQGDKLKPGDIILTHWRPDLYKHLPAALRDIANQGFKVAALQDYLPDR